ncbi:RNA-directed DNA polymerase (Reverse transcriptase), partial [Trifolium medium]|nr:RNA-directed DNA polymerase (Reverse transcriptase) [Trifolium medium]
LWTLKAILRSFELASGLKVNFAKSCVMGVNVSSDFLDLAERFLHCRIGSLPFMYLGLPVGANPRKEITWKPLLDTLAKRLNDWQNSVLLNYKGNSYGEVLKRIVRLLGLAGRMFVNQKLMEA